MMTVMRNIIFTILLLPSLLLARQKIKVTHPGADIPYEPWFTAPLLAPTSVNMKPGHPAILPTVSVLSTYGLYDSNWKLKNADTIWAITPSLDFQFATTENTGVEIFTSFTSNFLEGKSTTRMLDTFLFLGYQALHDQKDSWVPDLRIFFETIFPTGKHDRLDPTRETLDFYGQGAYFFGPNIAYQKLFYLPNNFFLLHLSIGYFFPTRAKIHNLSVYGGGSGTKGTIRPGQSLIAFFSGEYSINQRWVFAYDTVFLHQTKTSRFSGEPGFTETGELAEVGLPSSTQISFAPTIEYNFSARAGLLFGAWFTIVGRNSSAFAGGFLAYAYVF